MNRARRSSAAAAALAAVALLAGCGSTAQSRALADGAPAADSGFSLPGEAAVPGAPGGPGGPGAAVPPPAGGAPVPGGDRGPAAQPGGAVPQRGAVARPTAAAGSVRGVTATTIRIGALYVSDSGAVNNSLGASDLSQGDARDYYRVVLDDVNRRGGIAGRRATAVFHELKGTSGEDVQTQMQAACERFTRDQAVFAVLDVAHEVLRSCLHRAGIAALYSGASGSTSETLARYPSLVEVSSIVLDRGLQVTVDMLAAQGFYASRPPVGIVTWDDPAYRRAVEKTMLPALARLGVRTVTQYVNVPSSAAGVSESSAATNSAVLRFRSEGVTHVHIADGPAGFFQGTGLTVLFLRSAGAQRYFPRYGFNDANSPSSGMQAGLWSADDVRGAHAVSWSNALDESDQGATPNETRKRCLELMRKAGVRITNLNARGVALVSCDQVWFLQAVMGSAATAVTPARFLDGVAAIGRRHRSPLAYATRFDARRHDGIAAARTQVLDDGCDCYRYTSPPRPLP